MEPSGAAGRGRLLWRSKLLRTLLLVTLFLAGCGGGAAHDQLEGESAALSDSPQPEAPSLQAGDDPETGPTRLLPDLLVSEPAELYIQIGSDGVREIRFSTTIANLGEGPLLMAGEYDIESGEVGTVQRIRLADGSLEEYEVGRFVYDDGHEHWHLTDFIVFELWSLTGDGYLDRVLASTGKMTFCLADSHPVATPPPNFEPNAGVTSCDEELQGISVGWEDIYEAALPGQELDIPDIADGRYAIRSVVDPDGLLLETNDENNETVTRVEIAGSVIRYVE